MTDIETIRERWEKATPGPWAVFDDHPEYIMRPDKPGSDWDGTIVAELPRDEFDLIDYPTAEAIAHAPQDIAALLRIIGRVIELRDQLARTDMPPWLDGAAAAEAITAAIEDDE